MSDTISQWAIYERPSDFRDGYVVREWLITGDEIQPGDATRHASLEEARASLPPDALRISGVDPNDPTIIEVWM